MKMLFKSGMVGIAIVAAMALGMGIPTPIVGETIGQGSPQDSLAEAKRLTQQAFKLYQQGRYNEAIPLVEKALAIRKKMLGENHPDTANSLNNLAELYRSQGRYAAAEPLYKEALAIRKKQLGANHPDTAQILNNLALLYYSQGRYAAAEILYKEALAIIKKQLGDNHPLTATNLNNLALLYQSQGRYTEAEPLYKEALAIRKKQLGANHPDTAQILNNLALLYYSQRRYAAAEPLYKEALAIRKKQLGANYPDTAQTLNNLAELYRLQGRYAAAEPLYKESLAIRKKQLGTNHSDTANSFNNLAELYRLQGRYTEAEPLYKESLAIRKKQLGANHPDTANSLNNLALLYYFQGRYAAAETLYKESLAIRKKQLGANHPDTANSLNNFALLYQSQGDIPRTIEYLTQGIAIEEANLSQNLIAGDDKQKQDFMATVVGTTNGVISFNLKSAADNLQVTRLSLQTILQRKGRILDVLTNSLQILRRQTNDPESQKLLDQLIQKQTQLANLTFKKAENIKSIDAYRQELLELQAETQQLADKLSRRSAEFRILSQPISLDRIRKLIPADAALVEIVRYRPFNSKATKDREKWGNPRYAVYILYPNGDIKAKDLGEAKPIDNDLADFRSNLRDKQTSIKQVRASARQLDAKLMQPIRQLLGKTKTILLSPDSGLNLIPFEALVDENYRYLVENYQINYLTSGRDLLRLKDKFPSQQSPIVIANPAYNRSGQKVAINSADTTRSLDLSQLISNANFVPLQETETEAKAIKTLFPQAIVLTQSQATENAIKQVKNPDFLHIATHGFFLESPKNNNSDQTRSTIDNPLLRSGLVLAGVKLGQSAGDDGILTALEITNLNLVGTKLVVLSACETGLGDTTTGDGVYGLRRALVIAGSESQVISLWKVSDEGTRELMVKYYARLKQGEGRSEALRQIKLEMLKSEKYQHPSYWASFIPSGDATPIKF